MVERRVAPREMMTFRYLSRLLILATLLHATLVSARPTKATSPEATAAAKTAKETAHEAAVVAKQAKAYYGQKQFALAAELYRRAFELNPTRPEFLYGVGRSEQMAGHLPQAREALEKLRQLLPPTHKLQSKAAEALVEMQEVVAEPVVVIPEPVAVTPTTPVTVAVDPPRSPTPLVAHVDPTPPPIVVAQPSPETGHTMTQAAMWTGGAFVVTGIALALWAQIDRSLLNADLGAIRGTEASSRQETINSLSTASVVAVAAGAGALALGLYWRIGEQSPAKRTPTLTATLTSVGLSWRF